jgi:DNA-binding NarL/FixJ family response regulator
MDGEILIREKIDELRGKPQMATVEVRAVVKMLKSMLARLEEHRRLNPPRQKRARRPHPQTLDPEIRQAIIEELEQGHVQKDIARKWGVSQALVSKINIQECR